MDNQTIIVKKIKKGGHGHHGGAWKVAFADFVTAMMAFFLLLWLLAAARPEQQAAIAAYFIDPLQHAEARKAADSMIDHGGQLNTIKGQQGQDFQHGTGGSPSDAQADINADPRSMHRQAADQKSDATTEEAASEKKKMESLMEEIKKQIESNPSLKPYKDQLLLDITPEGLRIQIVDKENRPMFDSGSTKLKPYTKEIMHVLAKAIDKVPNKVSLTGHTDAVPFYGEDEQEGWTNWELSSARANASRRELITGGLGTDKVAKVVGLADTLPFDQGNPRAPINRRIAIIVMNKAAERALLQDASKISEILNKAEDVTPVAEENTLSGAVVRREEAMAQEKAVSEDAAAEPDKPSAAQERLERLREKRRQEQAGAGVATMKEDKVAPPKEIKIVDPINPIQFNSPIRDD